MKKLLYNVLNESKIVESIMLVLISVVMIGIPSIHYFSQLMTNSNKYISTFIYTIAIIGLLYIVLIDMFSNVIKLKWNTYEIIFFILIILEILCVLFSDFKQSALWGENGRNEGLFILLSYYIFFYMARLIQNESKKRIAVYVFLSVGVIQSLYGLCQYYGLFPNIVYAGNIGAYKRISGLSGNSDFFGSLLVLLIGISVGLFIVSKSKQKIYSFGLSILFMITLFHTSTLSAIVGLVAIFGICGLYIINGITKKRIKVEQIFYYIGCIVLILLLLFVCYRFGNIKLLYRIQGLFEDIINQDSKIGSGRIEIWKNVLNLWKEKMFFGYGIDSLKIPYFRKYGYQNAMEHVYLDKAHNEYLQLLVTMGLPVLITYLTLYFVVIKDNLIKLRTNKYALLFILAIGGYLVQAFFNISVIRVAPFFWIVLGLSCDNAYECKKSKKIKSKNKQN